MVELAEIVREAGPAYRQRFAARMPPSHLKALRDIERCRTAALGGHLRQCDACQVLVYSYHSCRNRHCPKCHGEQTRRWLAQQRARLLPCAYYLLTFTLPAQLRDVARAQQHRVYGLLFTAAAESLRTLAADPRYLGARPGLLAVLHTWTRALLYHPHVHMLVTAGGLTPDGAAWRDPRHPTFLVPARALSVLFRAKVKAALARAGLLHLVRPKAWTKRWVVHVQPAGTGQQVLDYLARYLFRIALANSRIERFQDGQVTFRYRENASGQLQHCRLPAQEFLRRFLQHVLPRGFTKVRSYGLYSPTAAPALAHARELLTARGPTAAPPPSTTAPGPPPAPEPTPPPEPTCPTCRRGVLRIIQTLPPAPPVPPPTPPGTRGPP